MERYDSTYVSIFVSGKYSNLLQLADGKLRTEDGFIFDIHRVILACKSEYFRAMFCGLNKNRREFTIPGISGRCLAVILRYLYTEENCVNAENMAEVLTAVDYLMIENLHNEIKEIVKDHIRTNNCLQVLQVANLISDEEIARKSLRFLYIKFEELVRTSKPSILDLSFEPLQSILSSGSLYVCKESIVWETIVEWTQKDASSRLRYVPQLLMCLASGELDENLSSSILEHAIVSQNPSMRDLQKIIASTNSTNNMNILLHYLGNYSNAFEDSNGFRIPSHLHVISSSKEEGQGENLYITFDENIDLWQKIGEADFSVVLFLVAGHYICFFQGERCAKFDLVSRQWTPMLPPMRDLRQGYVCSVTYIDEYIYMLRETELDQQLHVAVYDVNNDTWLDDVLVLEIYGCDSVTIDKKIYVVGKTRDAHRMAMQAFDTVTRQSSELSAPTKYRFGCNLVAHRKKIYVMGGYGSVDEEEEMREVEAYSTETETWEYLPDLPYTYSCPGANVINDRIIVFDFDTAFENTQNVSWNDATGKWEKLAPTCAYKNFYRGRFGTVDDVDTLRSIKGSRTPSTEYEKFPFN